MIELRQATDGDIATILSICADAREFQRMQGYVQWADGYPSEEVIRRDIDALKGYVIMLDSSPAGYCVIDTDGDQAYDALPHIWDTHEPYVAVHRLAISATARGKGLSVVAFKIIEQMMETQGISILKVDTGTRNTPMHRLMARMGFKNQGAHTFPWGERLAFEKVIR